MKHRGLILLTTVILAGVMLAGCSLPAGAMIDEPSPTTTMAAEETTTAAVAATSQDAAASDKIVVQLQEAQDKNSVSVSATGTIKVTPDVAYSMVGVVTQKKKMQDAQNANRELMNKVIASLKVEGLSEDDIRTTNYSVSPMYDYSDGSKISGYEVNNMVELTIRDIDKVGEILDAAAAAGANTSYSVNFDLLDKAPSYNKALSAAMEAARAKADTLAAAGGFTVKSVMNVSEGYNSTPVYYEYAAAAEDSVNSPTYISSGDMDITANVSVVYEIEE